MAQIQDQAAGKGASTQATIDRNPEKVGSSERRVQEAIEDDEAREALKSMHALQDREKAG